MKLKVLFPITFLLMGIASVMTLLILTGGTVTNEAEITIDAAPEAVFGYLTDGAQLTRWMAYLEKSEAVTEPPVRVGSRGRETVVDGDHEMVMMSEITTLDHGRELGVRLDAEGFWIDANYALEPDAGRTKLTYTSKMHISNLLFRMAALAIKRSGQKSLEEDLGRLKALVEEETA